MHHVFDRPVRFFFASGPVASIGGYELDVSFYYQNDVDSVGTRGILRRNGALINTRSCGLFDPARVLGRPSVAHTL